MRPSGSLAEYLIHATGRPALSTTENFTQDFWSFLPFDRSFTDVLGATAGGIIGPTSGAGGVLGGIFAPGM